MMNPGADKRIKVTLSGQGKKAYLKLCGSRWIDVVSKVDFLQISMVFQTG